MKCVDAALAPMQLQGIRILNYIDDWLILAQSEQVAVRHRDVVLAQMKDLGLRLNAKKIVLPPVQRTTYLGVVWDSTTMQARLSPARIDSILATVKRVREGQSLTVKQFQKLLGLMAAASNVIPFGLLYMRSLQWWLRTTGFSPRGQPISHDQGHAARLMCLRHVEETVVPVTRPRVGGSVSSRNANDGRLPHGLGSRACQILPWAQGKLLSLRAVYIPGYLNQGADILLRQGLRPGEWMLHTEVMKQIWKKFGRAQVDLFASRETSQCPLWFSLTHPAPLGLDAMVQIRLRLRLYAFPRSLCSWEFWREFVQDGVRLC